MMTLKATPFESQYMLVRDILNITADISVLFASPAVTFYGDVGFDVLIHKDKWCILWELFSLGASRSGARVSYTERTNMSALRKGVGWKIVSVRISCQPQALNASFRPIACAVINGLNLPAFKLSA